MTIQLFSFDTPNVRKISVALEEMGLALAADGKTVVAKAADAKAAEPLAMSARTLDTLASPQFAELCNELRNLFRPDSPMHASAA